MKLFYPILNRLSLTCALVIAALGANAQYCTTNLYSYGCGIEWIGNVTTTGGITNINNSTSCTGGTGAASYTQGHTTALGSTVNFSVTNGASCCSENFKIFVDWNQDQDWLDVGEDVANFSIAASGTYTGSFTVPVTANVGTTRMRVRLVYGGTSAGIVPCTQTTYGEAEDYDFTVTSPCVAPTNLGASNITSQSATVSWTPPTPSVGSDYVVTTTATPPSTGFTTTTGSSALVTGLTPSTQYYLYVRNKCSATSFSMWVQYPFMTLPPCQPPVGFKTPNLAPTGTGLQWDPWPSATSYDYIVDQSRLAPTSTTGLKNITSPTDAIAPGSLTENTWYFVHIRSNCVGGEMSGWGLDSFLTPLVCRAPNIGVSHINTDHAVAHWEPVPSATHYEYAITTSPTPPAIGTKYMYTSIQTSALYDGKDYFIHVRSHCNSVGIVNTSDWGTASFKTFPVSVSNVNGNDTYVEAYPNPVQGTLNVNVYGLVDGNAAITVTDISGKVLRQVSITSAKTSIDMSDLASGVYLLKYVDDNRAETIKITKQ
ncbi:MAG: Fibronectin type domain protein [Flavipsychrobacter sp.]|nr:Fibronectin type domain protein [Flavipsychrobacter sp.]